MERPFSVAFSLDIMQLLPEATANICGHVDNHPNVNGSGGFVRARSGLRVGDIFDSRFSKLCDTEGSVRLPLDVAGEILCLPAHLSVRSKVDLIVPPVFAAAFLVRAVGLWEQDRAH
ncbi:hypothetical protein CFP56_002514 [Quercus suber]|uniref:Uncharacterized protein n=1 Tax=Quercus suber TaxID=58331 RepID=A0AAW0LDH8_QUESU